MARRFLTAIDLALNQLQNAVLQVIAGDPGAPVEGQVWYDSVAQRLKFRAAASTIDPTVRAAHTGSQTAATISDFDTQVRTSRLDQMAPPTAPVSVNNQAVTNLPAPVAAGDAVRKSYVDDAINGLDWKPSVRVATTANITLSGEQVIDGVTTAASRVLVKNQTTGSENGLYLSGAGPWARTAEADTNAEVTPGLAVFVEEGTANGNQQWVLTTDAPITLGTTALTFAQVGSQGSAPAAGAGLTLVSNTYDVGAGNGISVSADAVAVDTAVVARKFAAAVGDGTATSYVVTHNLGTQDVTVAVYAAATPWAEVECDVEHTSTTTVTVRFAAAPATGAYRVVVHG